MLGHGTLKISKDEDLCDDNKDHTSETERCQKELTRQHKIEPIKHAAYRIPESFSAFCNIISLAAVKTSLCSLCPSLALNYGSNAISQRCRGDKG